MSDELTKERLEDLYVRQRLSMDAVGKIINKSQGMVLYHLKKWQIPRRGFAETKFQDLTGKVFFEWTVLGPHKKIKDRTYWLCRCSCGREDWVKGMCLYTNGTQRCKKCRPAARSKPRRLMGPLGGAWGVIVHSARRRLIELKITEQDAYEQFQKQKGCCALSGLPINLRVRARDRGNASLDRIDNSRGYLPGNIQWVDCHINMMRGSYSIEHFKEMCRAVAQHTRSNGTYE